MHTRTDGAPVAVILSSANAAIRLLPENDTTTGPDLARVTDFVSLGPLCLIQDVSEQPNSVELDTMLAAVPK
jgi:hypothetical protein